MYIYPFLSSSNFWFNRAITDMGIRPKLTVTSVVISGRQPIYSVLLLLLVVKGKCDDASEAKKNIKNRIQEACMLLADSSISFFALIRNSGYI